MFKSSHTFNKLVTFQQKAVIVKVLSFSLWEGYGTKKTEHIILQLTQVC